MLSRRLSLLAAIIFVGAAVRFILPVSAGDEWLPITPEELKMTSDPKAPGAPAITLYRQVDRDDSDPMRPHEYNYVRKKIFTEEGRKANPDLEIGICGEHGGDPASIHFCHALGLNYVSCSPYRVPVARLAAAQAAMATSERDR